MSRIYLDNSATTKVSKEVLEAMLPYFTETYGNPSSLHTAGRQAREAVDRSREQVAKAINAEPSEIIFTSGGTEADNMAIVGAAYANRKKGNHIITSSIEHAAILETCKSLEKEGFRVTYLPVGEDGIVRPEEVAAAITPETTLISIMQVNNEIGTVQPIKEIGKIAGERNIYLHTDAVQAMGKVKVDVKDLGVNMLSISGHKIHAPKGIGVLYIKKGTRIKALLHGGGHEKGLRNGTENVPGIAGIGKACEIAVRDFDKNTAHMARLRDRLIDGLLNIDDVMLNGHRIKRSPNNVNVGFRFIEGESLVLMLDMAGIEASTGSACSSRSLQPSHVLTAIGRKPEEAHGSLRLTNCEFNTEEEIGYVLETIPGIVSRLRAMSPLYKKTVKEALL